MADKKPDIGGRPRKEGLDFFPHDTDASSDEKVEALRALYGNDGYAFFFIMLERIYRSPGFCIVFDAETREETIQILSKKIGIPTERFFEMLEAAFRHKCFDREKYDREMILTSPGIQKRAARVQQKRDKMRERFLQQKDDRNHGRNLTSKEKKSKEKQSKEEVIVTPEKASVFEILKKVDGYPFDPAKDNKLLDVLIQKYPKIDPVSCTMDWQINKLGNPLNGKSNARNQINQWFAHAAQWGKNQRQDSHYASPKKVYE